jgi:hypothetical protein
VSARLKRLWFSFSPPSSRARACLFLGWRDRERTEEREQTRGARIYSGQRGREKKGTPQQRARGLEAASQFLFVFCFLFYSFIYYLFIYLFA